MRFFFVLLFLFFTTACIVHKRSHSKVVKDLVAVWFPIREEIAGTKIPPVAYQSQKLELGLDTYILTAESIDQGEYKVDGNHMDIYGKTGPNAGKHITAIFEMKKDQLWICYDLEGISYPTSFSTEKRPRYFMAVFEKRK